MSTDDDEGRAAALNALKRAHVSGGREFSKSEAIDEITKPRYLGPPATVSKSKRGPKTKRTQYDLAYDRRKDLYRRLVRLPALRLGSGYVNEEEILALAAELSQTTPTRHLVREVQKTLELRRGITPDESTTRKVLRKNNYLR